MPVRPVGANYKSFAEQLVDMEMSEHEKEQVTAMLQGLEDRLYTLLLFILMGVGYICCPPPFFFIL